MDGREQDARRGVSVDVAPRRVLEAVLGVPFTDGNRVQVLRNGDQTFPALLAAIREATRTIDLLWFAWRRGEVAGEMTDALAERARAGVGTRVLLDGYGARHLDPAGLRRMRAAGCEVAFYRPLPSWRPTVWNLRTHRRVLVCDETVAFTGGTGISDEWAGDGVHPGQWRDTALEVRGPAVAGLRAAFAGPHLQVQTLTHDVDPLRGYRFPPLPTEGGSGVQVVSPASGPGWNASAVALAALLRGARRRVRVTTPYLRLPRWLRSLVRDTARRGVHVQLLVSGPHVERPSVHLQGQRDYQPLLDAGVEIWRYGPSLLHAKVVTVDGHVAVVGTSNFDVRSLTLNEQVCVLSDDRVLTELLDDHFEEDLDRSSRVGPEEWRGRPVADRALELAADAVGRPLRGWGGAGLAGRLPWVTRPAATPSRPS